MKSKYISRKVKVEAPWYAALSDEEKREHDRDEVMNMITALASHSDSFQDRLGRVAEWEGYFPGSNQLPPDGSWIMVKKSPPVGPYTIPPLSFWFAEPWPMESRGHTIHRVRVITSKGEIGLFPHEYSRTHDIAKLYPFIGDGMEIKFIGSMNGIPKDALFYIRSRGIPKGEAIQMLLATIKAHEVCWLKADRKVVESLGLEWPSNAVE